MKVRKNFCVFVVSLILSELGKLDRINSMLSFTASVKPVNDSLNTLDSSENNVSEYAVLLFWMKT